MLSNGDTLMAILDYVARGAILVIVFMLRQLFLLDKKFAILESEQVHQRDMAALESKKRDSQRRELLAAVEKNSDKLDAHNISVLDAIKKAVGRG